MIRIMKGVAALWVILFACCVGNVSAQSNALTTAEADALEFMVLYAELKNDYFTRGGGNGADPTLLEMADEESHYMDLLENLAAQYGVEVSDAYWGCNIIFTEYPELDFYCRLPPANPEWWISWEGYVSTGAYFEELGIGELREAIEITNQQVLVDTYTEMLGMSYAHLLYFASQLHNDPFDYEAQILSQADVDLALAEAIASPFELFVINSGLNDAWYDPTLDGQGFTVSVFEDKGTVFLAWFTYDTELPASGATANLGDPGQRWLTAQGEYEGRQAELVVYSPSGGIFNTSPPKPELDPIGSITLEFEDCYTGTVSYDLPGIGRSGTIPIQRVATDNVCNCTGDGQAGR
jgi:hypothetical protein